MRRALLALVLLFGVATAASAQAQARLGVRLLPGDEPGGPPRLAVHISNLLSDPDWADPFRNASIIRIHWEVQRWREGVFDRKVDKPIVWDDAVWQVPYLEEFFFREPSRGRTTIARFSTLDSLSQYVEQEQRLPAPTNVATGRFYYTVNATLSIEDPAGGTDGLNALQKFILGAGAQSRSLPEQRTVTFTIPPH